MTNERKTDSLVDILMVDNAEHEETRAVIKEFYDMPTQANLTALILYFESQRSAGKLNDFATDAIIEIAKKYYDRYVQLIAK